MELVLALTIGIAFLAGVLLIMAVASLAGGDRQAAHERLTHYTVAGPQVTVGTASGAIMRDRSFSRFVRLNRLLEQNHMGESIAIELQQARVPLRAGEYVLLRIGCGVVLGYLLAALGGNILAIVPGAAIGFFAPQVYVRRRRNQRLKALEGQLVDALNLSANSLRAGWGFIQAVGQVSNELPPPISEEFTEVLQEVNLGSSLEDATAHLLQRVPSYDLELLMTAILIQRQIGGNLAEMMDRIADTIRERVRLLADIASIIAESKMSMWLLGLLPVAMMILLAVVQPNYMLPFLTDPRGRLLLAGAAFLEIVGVLTMKRIANVNV